MSISHVYEVPDDPALQCAVTGRLTLPEATVELHRYRFRGPQEAVFRSDRGFIDLALSRRPGRPRGGFDPAASRPLGDVLFIPAGHALLTEWGEGEQTSVCCAFDATADDVLPAPALEAALDVRCVPVRDALFRLAREIELPGWCSEVLAQSLCTQLIVELGRYLQRSAGPTERATGLTATQLRQIDALIEQPGKLTSVAEMARLCDLSSRHFFRMFRAATGTTLAHYATARRLARAKQLLSATRPSVKEIAWQCGFETPAAFAAAFRRSVGVTPKEFRQSVLHG